MPTRCRIEPALPELELLNVRVDSWFDDELDDDDEEDEDDAAEGKLISDTPGKVAGEQAAAAAAAAGGGSSEAQFMANVSAGPSPHERGQRGSGPSGCV